MKDATLNQSVKILSIFSETPSEQIQAILESGLLADLRDGNIAQVRRDEFRQLLGLRSLIPISEALLDDPIGTVKIMAMTGQFVASEKFIRDTGHKAKVKISYLGDNFTEWFLGEDGKIEAPIGEQALCYARLKKSSVDRPIIAEIGGEAKAEATLAETFLLMEKQKNGEAGVLLNNGCANIFYIRDKKGVLRAVRVAWRGGGWGVGASSVGDSGRWGDGSRVFFRIPVAA